MRIKQAFAAGVLSLTPVLTGCTHTHAVLKTRPPDVVYSSTLDHLLQQVDQRYVATQSATLFMDMSSSSGGSMEGKITESYSFSGYIVIQNPDHIRVVLKVPVFESIAMQMVSDGKSFKMVVPPKSCAIVGSDQSLPTEKGLYSLRPAVILDSLLIRGLRPDEDVSMTQESRVIEAPKTKTDIIKGKALGKDLIQDPDYDIEFLSQPQGQVARTLRVLHIDRTNLLPWRQDIYNADGKIETQALYSNYQKFGGINFPAKIVIQRPLDELGLTITINKGTTFNQTLDADSFEMPSTSGYAVQNMDDPASAATNPCVTHPAATPAAPSK
jgi:hypothetical protein